MSTAPPAPSARMCWTITLGERAIDVIADNTPEAEDFMSALIKAADAEAFTSSVPEPQQPSNARAQLIDGVTTCECGSTDFEWNEQVDHWREQETNADGVLSFAWSDTNYGDGDDSPGVVCLDCKRAVDLPEDTTLDWDVA